VYTVLYQKLYRLFVRLTPTPPPVSLDPTPLIHKLEETALCSAYAESKGDNMRSRLQ
jgi:hypothetical protein